MLCYMYSCFSITTTVQSSSVLGVNSVMINNVVLNVHSVDLLCCISLFTLHAIDVHVCQERMDPSL